MQFLYTIQTFKPVHHQTLVMKRAFEGSSQRGGPQQSLRTWQPRANVPHKMLTINHATKVPSVEASSAYEPRCLRLPRLPLLLLLLSAYIKASSSSS